MNSLDGAKRSAAMKTCIKLHELKALNNKLLPATNDELTQNLDYLFPNWKNEDNNQSGTYKRKQEHKLKVRTYTMYVKLDLYIIIIYERETEKEFLIYKNAFAASARVL